MLIYPVTDMGAYKLISFLLHYVYVFVFSLRLWNKTFVILSYLILLKVITITRWLSRSCEMMTIVRSIWEWLKWFQFHFCLITIVFNGIDNITIKTPRIPYNHGWGYQITFVNFSSVGIHWILQNHWLNRLNRIHFWKMHHNKIKKNGEHNGGTEEIG